MFMYCLAKILLELCGRIQRFVSFQIDPGDIMFTFLRRCLLEKNVS